ncbi:MAG: DMT family transporter, partial [Bacteroidetes bacterium]|nr:DMT family transporter [Bacteroidota bacterium]
ILLLQAVKIIKIPVHFYALAAMLFWGMSFVWTSGLLAFFQPVTIIFVRLLISSAFLFLLMIVSGRFERIRREDLWLLLGSAVFNPFLYFLGENFGVKFTSATVSSVIIATIPVFSPIIAWLTFHEKISRLNIFGIFVSFSGVAIMLVSRDLSFSGEGKGVLALFGAVMSALVFSVFLKKLTQKYSPVTLVAWQNIIGALLFLPLFLIFERNGIKGVRFNYHIISSFLFLSVFASSLAFVFFAKTVKEIGIGKANIYSNLIPVFTAFFSFFLISEPFTAQKIAGIILVIGGVYLSERNKPS